MFETNEWWKGENSSLLELQFETSMNLNGDLCEIQSIFELALYMVISLRVCYCN